MRLLAVLVAAALLAGCNVEADFSENLETEILPAEQYQHEITSIDRLVFREEPLGEDGVRELEEIITGLAKRVGEYSDSKFVKIESLELRLLAKRAGRLSPDGTGKPVENDWMRIRNNVFDDRAWFARSARDLDYAASVMSPQESPKTIAVKPAPVAEKRSELTGKWRVVTIIANGEPREDDELTDSIWTFDPPRLVMRSPAGKETAFNFTPEGKYLRVAGPGEEGWILYELTGGELRVAFYDGLQGRPASFEHDPARKDPLLLVVRLAAIR